MPQMIALPAVMMTLLREVPMGAWGALTDILTYIVRGNGDDASNALVRAEALQAHAMLRTFAASHPAPPAPPPTVAIATNPKAT